MCLCYSQARDIPSSVAAAKMMHFQMVGSSVGLGVASRHSATRHGKGMERHIHVVIHTAGGRSSGWNTAVRSLEGETVVGYNPRHIPEGLGSVAVMHRVELEYYDMGQETQWDGLYP